MSLPEGYPQLSALMGPHDGMAIFRKFAELNVRNLAYMQAEILLIEAEVNHLARRDAGQAGDEKFFSKQVWKLRGTENCTQWERILELRTKLKEYNDALVLLAQVNKLDKANDRDLDILRKWLVLAGGNGFPYGIEAKAYDDSATSDLVAVSTRCPKGDSFTRWLADTAVPRFHQVVGYRWKGPIPGEFPNGEALPLVHYQKSEIDRLAKVVKITMACMLPTVTIVLLYLTTSMVVRLGVLVGFSVVFAVCVDFFTNARQIDVFYATLAFVAVQVVFVGSINAARPMKGVGMVREISIARCY